MIALRHHNEFVPEVTSGQQAGVLLDQTCFYAEAGGQIYDIGFLSKIDDEVLYSNLYVHRACITIVPNAPRNDTHTLAFTHTYVHIHTLYLLVHAHKFMFTCTRTRTHTRTHTHTHTHMHTRTHTHTHTLSQSTEIAVKNVQVRGGYVLHVGSVEGVLKVGDKVTCTIDGVRVRHTTHHNLYGSMYMRLYAAVSKCLLYSHIVLFY